MADRNDESDENYKVDILHPEIMSKETLLEFLRQRKIGTEDELGVLDKYSLVDVYYRCVLPLPQRKYRMNRRGRQMTKMQILLAKRKRTYDEMKSTDIKDNRSKSQDDSAGLLTSFASVKSSTPGDRLKPPPNAVNFERKTIKLSSKSSTSPNTPLPNTKSGVVKVNSSPKHEQKSESVVNTTCTVHRSNSVITLVSNSNSVISVTNSNSVLTVTNKDGVNNQTPSTGSKIKLKRTSSESTTVINEIHKHISGSTAKDVTTDCAAKMVAKKDVQTGSDASKSSESDAEDGVLRKKFKRIDIQWP